ncbi:hypothetical protein OG762_46275 [Streptomyces sp. NBC_01136]|uniref:hypothetical protein n=1 Tax=unclassified Streptomyces TaxID=2593676 RepID=UPI003253A74C|nr:hypothetical protein OG762_00350 [Streptomyces sp. NBC_01136]WST81188.1 hypothetical protein OG762_46275 [Streptomyces sp. NBC_01136]
MSKPVPERPVFDAHLHIIDPRFPLIENDGCLPPTFTVEQYRERTNGRRPGAWAHPDGSRFAEAPPPNGPASALRHG